jgi:RES domain-containing protein
MGLGELIKPWSGVALRHIPAGSRYDVLDFQFAGAGADNRWNDQGQPTLYLAGDEGVIIAEWGRHFHVQRDPVLKARTHERALYQLKLSLEGVLDLRQRETWAELSLSTMPSNFLEPSITRAIAQFVRRTTAAQAILVPSVAFLDAIERWCLVVFLEKVSHDPKQWITDVATHGTMSID